MKSENFVFNAYDGTKIFTYKWSPDDTDEIKGVVQICHGMAECAARYERFAGRLTEAHYIVYANDDRGHGKTAGNPEDVGYLGKDGFKNMLADIHQLNKIIRRENPGHKVFLFGHSMGSILCQRYIEIYKEDADGVILSGTSGPQGFALDIGIAIAKAELKRLGPKTKSERMNKLLFGNYNNQFKPNRTDFDWLSSDDAEVDKYVANPYCGATLSSLFYVDFLCGVREIYKKRNLSEIPVSLPVYITSGENDPVGKNCKTVNVLLKIYKKLGIKDVSHKFYKAGRHEILNEKNRDEVMKNIIDWINAH